MREKVIEQIKECCKSKSKVWVVCPNSTGHLLIYDFRIHSIDKNMNKHFILTGVRNGRPFKFFTLAPEKTVFFSNEEAEKALKSGAEECHRK